MGNEIMERVDQLEEKVKVLEGELARAKRAPKNKCRSGVRRRIIIFNIWCSCSWTNYRVYIHNYYLVW